MKIETIQSLYQAASGKCKTDKPWEFEWRFAEEVAEYCASICEEYNTPLITDKLGKLDGDDLANIIREDFGI